MLSIIIFLLTIALVSCAVIRYRAPPFLALFCGALFFGIASGMPPGDLVLSAASGMGRVFALLGLVILAGAVISKLMQEQRQIERIVSDLKSVTARPFALSGIAGYILAIPLMCCITAFVILEPVVGALGRGPAERKGLLYTAALGSLIAFALVYPTPVIVALFATLPDAAVSPLVFDLLMIPVSLVLLAPVILLMRHRFALPAARGTAGAAAAVDGGRFRAWCPFAVMGAAIALGGLFLDLSPSALIQIVMLTGLVAALALAPAPVRATGFTAGAKHAGVILFDLCGAGALGAVIGASPLGSDAGAFLSPYLPAIAIPFVLAALVQTAQGSRIVTAVITGEIVSGTVLAAAIDPVPLVLLISGGACIVSYVSDPYFWIVRQATGDSVPEVVKNYTLPLAAIGIAMAGIGAAIQVMAA